MKSAYLFAYGGRLLTEVHAESREEACDRAANMNQTEEVIGAIVVDLPVYEFRRFLRYAEVTVVDLPGVDV